MPDISPVNQVSTRRVSSPKEESSHATQGAAAPIQSTQLDRMQIYISRRQTSDDACFLSKREEVKRMVEHNETNVAYCVIPKVRHYLIRPERHIASYPRYVGA